MANPFASRAGGTGEGSIHGGARVAILGLGASGVAAARLALAHGGEVHVSDLRTDAAAHAAGAGLRALGARVELGGHDLDALAAAGTVVVSPGIPPDAPVLRALRERGVRWVSEPEFAVRFLSGALIAVTGTNGKTTTAALAAHLLEEAGIRAGLGGNVGGGLAPAASELALRDPQPEWVVLELSSFQLADIDTLSPDIGVLTNLAPDHLDRYPDVETYYADKARLFRNASSRSRWVLNRDQPEVEALAGDAPGIRYHFSLEDSGFPGAWLRDGEMFLRLDGEPVSLGAPSEMSLLGRHNVANALAAAVAAGLAGAPAERMRAGLRTFSPLPHRLEPVGERDGVLWVNDSKATNVAAAASAVLSLQSAVGRGGERRGLILLLGGKDKGEALAPLARVLPGHVRTVVCYGAAGPRFADALEGAVPVVRSTGSFDDAVRAGADAAHRGDLLLLAPACSSFDQFRNYEERGDRFRALARGEAS
jgi:UDP-N-acetylmuramoylalanine--D-glutamate ligase